MLSSPRRCASWILGIALIIFVVSLCFVPEATYDLFWQLRAGHDIAVSDHAPRADAYSWTRRGAPWVAHEWLCFWLLWKLHQIGGFAAIWIAETALIAATFTLIYIHVLRETEGNPVTAFLLTAASALLASGFFQPRPHLFTYLFLVITVIAARGLSSGAFRKRQAWLLPLLFLVWSNLHSGAVLGVAVLAAFAVGAALDARRDAAARAPLVEQAKFMTALMLACAAATIVNPYGLRIYEDLWATINSSTAMNLVVEWASPNFHQSTGRVLEVFLGFIVYAVAFTRRGRKTGSLIVLGMLILEALTANRNVPLLAVAGALLVAGDLQSSIRQHVSHLKDTQIYCAKRFLAAALAVTFAGYSVSRIAGILTDDGRSQVAILPRVAADSFDFDAFPSAACRFMERESFPRSMRMYNVYDAGGYLIWRLPGRPVFVDGRADIYFGDVLEDTNRIQGLSYGWPAILSRYGCDFIFTTSMKKQTRLYLNSPDWVLVYADRANLDAEDKRVNAMIFIRNRPEFAALIARCRARCPAAVTASQLLSGLR